MTTSLHPSKPAIVLVPGAWHSPDHFRDLTARLTSHGYKVVTDRNPSCDSGKPDEQSVANDAAAIRDHVIKPLIDAGHDVVLVMHSYGGCPGAAAALGLSKTELSQQGKKGGIIGLAFICAFLANEGDSLLSKLPGQQYDSWVKQHGDGQLFVEGPKNIFYNEVSSPADEAAIKLLRYQSGASLSSPSPPPAWGQTFYNGRRAYLQTVKDNCIPFVAQDAMVKYSGVQWSVTQFDTDHSPFLSLPDETAKWVVDQAVAFAAAI